MEDLKSGSSVTRRAFLGALGTVGVAALSQACRIGGINGTEPTAGSPSTLLPPELPLPTDTPIRAAPVGVPTTPTPVSLQGRVALVQTSDRADGVRRALDLLGINPNQGKHVFLKPNFNSADPAPGSTHGDVLRALVERLWDLGAGSITVGDRSGMGDTRSVMRSKGVFDLAGELGFETLVFEDLDADGWVRFDPPQGSQWDRGFAIARPCLEAEAIVQTCNLKTHRFGGHFTLSLKNSVGMAAKTIPGEGHNYMTELHNSPHQRSMIADLNTAYVPALVVLDGVEAFIDGGPESGTKFQPGVMLAGADRVALDAVGVAILRDLGTTDPVRRGPIFGQEQIARAVELGLGVAHPEEITIVTEDTAGQAYADKLRAILVGEGE